MRKILFLLIMGCTNIFSQTPSWFNHVSNYSFEIMVNGGFDNVFQGQPGSINGNPVTFGSHNSWNQPNVYGFISVNSYNWISEYWGQVFEWTSPLRGDLCILTPSVGTADILTGTTQCPAGNCARTGDNRGYSDLKEYLVVPLRQPLQQNKIYFIEYYFSNGSMPHSDFEVIFSEKQPTQCEYQRAKYWGEKNKFEPDFPLSYTGPAGYFKSGFRFQVSGQRDWMSIHAVNGNIDDIRIYEIPNDACRDIWYFDNTDFSYENEYYQAGDKIICGSGVDPEDGIAHISGPVYAIGGTSTILKAGNEVILEPGFQTLAGAYFETVIEPCSNNPCPSIPIFENHIEICSNDPVEILGLGGSSYGITYTWSPADNLDDGSSSNPTFTPPNSIGQQTLTVNMVVNCANGAIINTNQEVNVQWSIGNLDPILMNLNIYSQNITDTYYELDLNFGAGTTSITIDMVSDNGVTASETYYNGVDYTGTTFNWVNPWWTDKCDDQHLTFTAKNMCSGEEVVIQGLWEKQDKCDRLLTEGFTIDTPLQYEIFSPDGDGDDDYFFIYDSQNPTCLFNCDKWELLIWDSNENYPFFTQVVDRTGQCCPFGTQAIYDKLVNGIQPTINEISDAGIPYWSGYSSAGTGIAISGEIKHYTFRVWSDCDNGYSQTWGGVVAHNGTGSNLVENGSGVYGQTNLSMDEGFIEKDLEKEKKIKMSAIKLYPNPSNDEVSIQSDILVTGVIVRDSKGSIVLESKEQTSKIDISRLESGVYIFYLTLINEEHKQLKFVKN